MSARRRRGSARLAVRARPQRAEGAGVGVDEPRPDGRPGVQTHCGCGVLSQAAPEARPWRGDVRAEAGEAAGLKRAQAQAVEEFPRPAVFVREIAELAGCRAQRARQRPGRAKAEPVGEADEMRGPGEGLGRHAREPDELRRLHLGRERSPEIAQDLVSAGVDPLGVFGRAVIHPHDHVALGRAPQADRERRQVTVEREERAGRSEAKPGEGVAIEPRRLDRFAHGFRHRAPDVGRRLLDDVALLAPDRNRSPRRGEEPPGSVERARAGAARADVDSDIGPRSSRFSDSRYGR